MSRGLGRDGRATRVIQCSLQRGSFQCSKEDWLHRMALERLVSFDEPNYRAHNVADNPAARAQ